jgi:hypothetical protein
MEIKQEKAGRVIGSLVGLACGDAVGTPLEFMRPGSFTPITDMGHFHCCRGNGLMTPPWPCVWRKVWYRKKDLMPLTR